MTTFSYTPEFGANGENSPSVEVVKFGDGYEQRIAKGMNTLGTNWNLTFANRETSEAQAILAFLTARGAQESFLFTPPYESTAKVFVCRKWSQTPGKGEKMTITATFEEVFEP